MLHHYLRGGLVLLSLSIATVSANAQGKWRAGAPIPQGANEVIGGTIDGQMFVYGGQDSANKPMGIFWRYDPAKNEWASLPSNPVPVHHGASATVGRKFYVFGGFRLPDTGKVGWYPEDKAWVYDVDSARWSALPNMPTPRGALAAVAVGKKIYVVGGAGIPKGMQLPDGLSGGGPVDLLGTTEVLDTDTNTWTSVTPMPTPRNHHSVAYADGKIYASKVKENDLKTNAADLSQIEKDLMWIPQDVKPQAPGSAKAKSLLDEFVKLFGVTS